MIAHVAGMPAEEPLLLVLPSGALHDGDVAVLFGRKLVCLAEVLGDHLERLAGDLDGLGVGEAVVDAGELLVGDLHALARQVGGQLVHLVAQRERLERGTDPPHAFAVRSTESKVDAIARAQADGTIPDHFEPRALLALILNLAALWITMSPDVLAVVDITDLDQRRKIVRDATARLLAN